MALTKVPGYEKAMDAARDVVFQNTDGWWWPSSTSCGTTALGAWMYARLIRAARPWR
jgi:hypothetical protein